jgi:quercetin dioxygenase-like cupin family protein
MYVFDLESEQKFSLEKHVEQVLQVESGGDVTIACWEPGQVSPNHCHPASTEIYFCHQGGGKMKTEDGTVDISPGAFVVHPPGELHEYTNGPERTMLFRIRYGTDFSSRVKDWPTNSSWQARESDKEYFPES